MKFLPRKRSEKEIIEKKKTFEHTRRLRKAKYLMFNWLNWRKTHISYLGNLEFVFLVSGWVNFFIKTKNTWCYWQTTKQKPKEISTPGFGGGKKGPIFLQQNPQNKKKNQNQTQKGNFGICWNCVVFSAFPVFPIFHVFLHDNMGQHKIWGSVGSSFR